MNIDPAQFSLMCATVATLDRERNDWIQLWRDIADYFIPKRYTWLESRNAGRLNRLRVNPKIVDGTGTFAGRVLASGMMSGITSPSRPWFKLRLAGFADDVNYAARVWLDEVERRILLVMAQSNFYNALALLYLDLVFFGTASMLIYEDVQNVICCHNQCLGEFYLAQNDRGQVDTFCRKFTYTVKQTVQAFGVENCSARVQEAYRMGGARLQEPVNIVHLIEPNDKRAGSLSPNFAVREYYWEEAHNDGKILRESGYFELPGVFPRWELTANDSYGTSPALDALGDVKQLQQETIRKAQSLDHMVKPHMLMDIQLMSRPTAMIPGGQTFIAGLNNGNVGAKPAFQFIPPIGEMTADIRDVQARIMRTFHNDLFRMISELETVRTATEIDARREEKLVLLGPVLERFENECLDPAINRIFNIMTRAGLIPPAPEDIQDANLEIQYVSILTAAQSAVDAVPLERFLQLVGNISAVYEGALDVPNWNELLVDYGRSIGVKAKHINSLDEIVAAQEQRQGLQGTATAIEGAQAGAQAAKTLAETDVGGGANALQMLLG